MPRDLAGVVIDLPSESVPRGTSTVQMSLKFITGEGWAICITNRRRYGDKIETKAHGLVFVISRRRDRTKAGQKKFPVVFMEATNS
jgi:hypothetical protein